MSMHETMKRLYSATVGRSEGYGVQTELANLLGVSPQVVANWEKRGISRDGLLIAESKLEISPKWITDGSGNPKSKHYELVAEMPPLQVKAPALTAAANELATLYDLIPESDKIRRARAYNAASAAILDVLQETYGTAQTAQDQRKPTA